MIYYLATQRFSSTVGHFLRRYRRELHGVLTSLTYEELFFERAAPIGHYIFTDFDRLSRYELEAAANFAARLRQAAPEVAILNHPLRALERYPLLMAFHKAGINDFTATRIEAGDRPRKYPVFIRAEDGYGGPETDILKDDREFDAAIAELERRGLPLRGRIAIGFANERSPDGYFHKYGAFNINGEIVPNDLTYGQSWVVKVRFANTGWGTNRDESQGSSKEGAENELRYIKENPHADILRRAFKVAGIEYGRADYGIVDGRVQIYEINTNPHLPVSQSSGARAERHALVQRSVLDAIRKIDRPISASGRVAFTEARPRAHDIRLPSRRLPASIVRRAADAIWRRRRAGQPKSENGR